MRKRLVTLIIAGCMVFSMTACANNKEVTENTSTETTTNTETTESEHVHTNNSKLIKLGEYKGVTYIPMDTTVTDEEVETEIQNMVSTSFRKTSQEIATETSVVNIDYVGKKDGVAFEGGTAQGQELDLGNTHYIEGFAESIVGMKVGETKDCPMTFPEDYHAADLAGAEVVFTITVNDCWLNTPAELNDDFAVSNGYDNVDALYDGVRERYELSKQNEAKLDKEYQVIENIIAASEFDIDDNEVEHFVDDTKSEYEYYASAYGYDLATYVSLVDGVSLEDFEKLCRENAEFSIKASLIKEEIEKVENLTVSDELYNEKATEYAEQYGYKTAAELEADYTKESIMEQITYDLVLEFIAENAVAEAKSE